MISFFQKFFQKAETVDQDKIIDQVRLSFESSQFDKSLFLEMSLRNDFGDEYQHYLNHVLPLRIDQSIDLKQEIDNLEKYLFFIKSNKLNTHFFTLDIKGLNEKGSIIQIAPFILFPIVQSAFYNGYNSMAKYPVRIRIHLIGATLKLEVSNRVNHHLINQELNDEIRWFKTRLQSMYADQFTLIFNSNSSLFKATLLLEL